MSEHTTEAERIVRDALAKRIAELEAKVKELEGYLRSVWCRTCGKPVEPERACFAIPTCYACLPPPQKLPTITAEEFEAEGADRIRKGEV